MPAPACFPLPSILSLLKQTCAQLLQQPGTPATQQPSNPMRTHTPSLARYRGHAAPIEEQTPHGPTQKAYESNTDTVLTAESLQTSSVCLGARHLDLRRGADGRLRTRTLQRQTHRHKSIHAHATRTPGAGHICTWCAWRSLAQTTRSRPGHNPCPSQHPGQTLPVGSTPAARRSLSRPNRHGHPGIFRKRMKWFDAVHAMAGSSGVFAHEGGERAYPLPWLLQEGEKKMPQSRFCLEPCSKATVKPNGPRPLVWFKPENQLQCRFSFKQQRSFPSSIFGDDALHFGSGRRHRRGYRP